MNKFHRVEPVGGSLLLASGWREDPWWWSIVKAAVNAVVTLLFLMVLIASCIACVLFVVLSEFSWSLWIMTIPFAMMLAGFWGLSKVYDRVYYWTRY